jgi:hypothetical protein
MQNNDLVGGAATWTEATGFLLVVYPVFADTLINIFDGPNRNGKARGVPKLTVCWLFPGAVF